MPVVILTGFMGTGKTAVGRRLAKRLGLQFVDTDALIEQREKRPIAEIFARDGEAYFRARESEMVGEVAALANAVVATGGGTVIDEENLRRLEASGPVICLTATPATIERRTAGSGRPLLEGEDRRAEVRQLLARRESVYRRVSECIDTSALDVEQVVDRIVALLGSGEGVSARPQ